MNAKPMTETKLEWIEPAFEVLHDPEAGAAPYVYENITFGNAS